ncbi:MAG: LysE family translocator [Burkholderiaceae bacterium]
MSSTLTVFAAAAFVTVASPGPTSLLALNNGARWGVRAALPGVAGAALSDLVLISAVALGLGALVAATPWALEALRWAGVACLAWLGVQLLRSPATPPAADAARGELTSAAHPTRVLLRSFSVAVSNPKGYLFFLALLPAFINPQAPALAQYLGLALTFAAIDAAVLLAYASAGALGAARLGQTTRGARQLDVISGVLLLGMAAALALWRRA